MKIEPKTPVVQEFSIELTLHELKVLYAALCYSTNSQYKNCFDSVETMQNTNWELYQQLKETLSECGIKPLI